MFYSYFVKSINLNTRQFQIEVKSHIETPSRGSLNWNKSTELNIFLSSWSVKKFQLKLNDIVGKCFDGAATDMCNIYKGLAAHMGERSPGPLACTSARQSTAMVIFSIPPSRIQQLTSHSPKPLSTFETLQVVPRLYQPSAQVSIST
jgi:hypothetical protein